MPTVTEPRSGKSWERTRTPLARRVACIRLPLRLPAGLLFETLLAREANLPRLVDLEDLYVDDVALRQHVGDLADPLVRELRDVHQPVGAGHDLDERSEVDDLAHRTTIDLADLGIGREAANAVDGPLHRRPVGRRDVDRAVVLDVDLDAGLLDDAADDLPTGPDEVPDA